MTSNKYLERREKQRQKQKEELARFSLTEKMRLIKKAVPLVKSPYFGCDNMDQFERDRYLKRLDQFYRRVKRIVGVE